MPTCMPTRATSACMSFEGTGLYSCRPFVVTMDGTIVSVSLLPVSSRTAPISIPAPDVIPCAAWPLISNLANFVVMPPRTAVAPLFTLAVSPRPSSRPSSRLTGEMYTSRLMVDAMSGVRMSPRSPVFSMMGERTNALSPSRTSTVNLNLPSGSCVWPV